MQQLGKLEQLHRQVFLNIFQELKMKGKFSAPRGLKVLECLNFSYVIPPYVRFMNFKSRKLNLNYIKEELKWYLKGNKFDTSITDHAKMWRDLINDDGSINSNYGQYIFGKQNQFDRVIKTLTEDKESRRAVIVILNSEHLSMKTADIPCTDAINFHIRDDKLNMSVRMRSQDAIYGAGNDIPTFSFIHEMMLRKLQAIYPNLRYGIYHHVADSFHVYERHFKMLDQLLGDDEFNLVTCPKILDSSEVDYLKDDDHGEIPGNFKFSRWLNTYEQVIHS